MTDDADAEEHLGVNVTYWRKKRGLSKTGLARASGLSRSTIHAIENGRYESADTGTVLALERALGLERGVLLRPKPQRAPTAPLVEAFRASSWWASVSPTQDEIDFLLSLPEIVFFGAKTEPEDLAGFLLWRRASERKKG